MICYLFSGDEYLSLYISNSCPSALPENSKSYGFSDAFHVTLSFNLLPVKPPVSSTILNSSFDVGKTASFV